MGRCGFTSIRRAFVPALAGWSLVLGALAAGIRASPPIPASAAPVSSLSVQGNDLVDGGGTVVQLHGVNRVGALYPCIQGWGIFDGPSDSASAAAIAGWHTNAVRLQLNEDCWLGINGVNGADAGSNYQGAIVSYVNLLHQAGLYVILSLTWSAPGQSLSSNQPMMADADHAPNFWQSVATTFKADPAVIFDLYSAPHGISWDCWRNGCTTSGGWQAAGMQTLANAVRGTGATQPLLLSGLNWANDLSGWLPSKPSDPANALVAGFHESNGSGCNAPSCWSGSLFNVAQTVPVVIVYDSRITWQKIAFEALRVFTKGDGLLELRAS